MQEVVRIRLWQDPPLVWFLYIILITLLIGKVDSVFLCLEFNGHTLHEVGRGLPAHEGVLPSVTLGKWVPVNLPAVGVPCTGLCCGFRWTVDSATVR